MGDILYSQLQPWSTMGVTPCMEQVAGPPVSTRVGQYYHTPRPHPWRPTMGYENVQVTPLPSQPVTNCLMDPCYTPAGMKTEPLKFPNLVTGFETKPAHSARAALYTRFTPQEWVQNNNQTYEESDTNRNHSEQLRGHLIKVLRETDEKATGGQREVGRRLGERITDITFWRNEVRTEIERLLTETSLLESSRKALQKAIIDVDAPMHIAQECVYHREHRQGVDLAHDIAEQALLRELEVYRNAKETMTLYYGKISEQLRNNRAAQHLLETDVRSKESALGIDNMCHQLNNFSKGINYYGGIERYDPTVTNTDSWAENSNRIVQRSQNERARSTQMRSEIDNLVNTTATQIWDAWVGSNNSLARRAAETLEAKSKLQMHLHKIQQEIFDVEKNIELFKKAVLDKANPLKVAQTRLEARTHRSGIELCKDIAQNRLIQEVNEIQETIDVLHVKIQEAEADHQQLMKTRANLETELYNKVNSLFIDREKCMGMRRSFPITATVKY